MKLTSAHHILFLKIQQRPNQTMTFLPAEDKTLVLDLVSADKVQITTQNPLTVQAVVEW